MIDIFGQRKDCGGWTFSEGKNTDGGWRLKGGILMEDKGWKMEYELRINVEGKDINGGWRLKESIWLDFEGGKHGYERRIKVEEWNINAGWRLMALI